MTPALFLATMLCLAVDAPATPSAFQFKDAATYENRPVLQYRAIEFRGSPVRPLGDRKFVKAIYGVVPVGPIWDTALTIVWVPQAPGGPELWLDANGDGRLTDDERHVMSGRTLEIPATVTLQLKPETKKVHRTLVFRRSAVGDGLRYTVRGYMQGRVKLGDKEHAALLIDGNANGCFDTVGQDRVWIDLNRDGRFDPLTEQFPLGKPITHDGQVYVIRSDVSASAVVANLRSAGQGKLRLTLARKPASPVKVSAELISDLGELINVDKLDRAESVPFGEYRLSSLRFEASDSHGRTWTYDFDVEQPMTYSVPTGHETTVTLLDRLVMDVSLSSGGGIASPGQTISIQPKLTADTSLSLVRCEVIKDGNRQQAEGNAEVLLLAPDGKVVDRGLTGFS